MTLLREVLDKEGKHYAWAFYCPGCDDLHVIDNRWNKSGSLDKPTFKPSVLVNAGVQYKNPGMPRCHLFVTDGQIQYLTDSTHKLSGKTIQMLDVDTYK